MKLQTFFFEGLGGNGVLSSIARLLIVILTSAVNEAYSESFRLTFKRVCVLLSLAIFLLFVIIWNNIGFVLDDIFFPEYKNEPINEPVFIIGNARSGTTYMHKLMCAEKRFSSFKLWELLFGLSVSLHGLIMYIYALDEFFLGSFLFRTIAYLESRTWGRVELHSIGLCEYEEDEWLHLCVGLSQLQLLLFPLSMDLLGPIVFFDEMKAEWKQQILTFYRTCVQRHLLARRRDGMGEPCTFLSKNPTFTLRISTLFEYFPDARFVCMVRDPAGKELLLIYVDIAYLPCVV